ncbi:Cell division protein FtsQ [Leucobacter sp. 7(1)]|uniref:FtsQ-type POTRA domain-containing protein n=1 Tax=Leucobacter sp. 7(1) TaxID=1255613 RepID=UPI00097EAE33|nr:FtsQ-type POTRA domain-containing protein [Leucobacter sp. 7(1)]SJN08367.1 Cell division protein FtsQ [Leucobacter sp. 7(1)]
MKRPSGFDQGPERPDPSAPGTEPDQEATPTTGAAPAESTAGARLIGRLRSRTAREAVAESGGTEQAPEHATPDPQISATSSDIAPTVDLSAVREARGAEDPTREPATDLVLPSEQAASGSALTRWRAAREADPVRAAERRVREAGKQRKARIRRERQRFTLAARRRRRAWWIVLSAVGTLVLFVAVGAFTPLMAVRDVQVVGAVNVDEAAVAEALSRFDGVPLALVDDAEVHRALEPFPVIQRYAVERTPPHTMTVRIEERVPVISLPVEGGIGQYDAAGVLLGVQEAAPAGVPLGTNAVADLSSGAFRSAARALRDMPAELRAVIASVSATSAQDVTFVLTDGIEVLWGDAEQTKRKAMVLSAMLGSLGDHPVEHVDVSSSEAPVFR